MDASTASNIKQKFYFKHLLFTEMRPIYGLEDKHRVNLGTGYENDKACIMFIEFIAKE